MAMQDRPDPYAPKPGRKRGNHDFGIIDIGDRVPSFLTQQDKPRVRPINRAIAELDEQLGQYIDRANTENAVSQQDYDPPQEPEPPLECLKFLVRKLSYGDMKKFTGEIAAKLGADADANKLADALHAVATQEDKP